MLPATLHVSKLTMQLLDHYYIILISAFSSQFGQFLTMLINTLWNFVIWEIRSYHSANMAKRSECERLLAKIRASYWFCTNYRAHVGALLTPTGFLVGDGLYIAYIDVVDAAPHMAAGAPSAPAAAAAFSVRIYGWWSVAALLTADVVSTAPVGNYNIVVSSGYRAFSKSTDSYDSAHFHKNCAAGARLILDNYRRRGDRGVYLLYGAPGLGKSTTARLIAAELNAWLVLDFEDFRCYNDSLVITYDMLYGFVQPDAAQPLVIVLDELEDFLFRSDDNCDVLKASGERAAQKDAPVYYSARNTKKQWVRLMDTLQEARHVVFILTTNRDKAFFDDLDPALLREFRVSACFCYKAGSVVDVPFAPVGKKRR